VDVFSRFLNVAARSKFDPIHLMPSRFFRALERLMRERKLQRIHHGGTEPHR
jgi:hypothetical protein